MEKFVDYYSEQDLINNYMFVIKYRKLFLSLSALMVAGGIMLVSVFGLNLGIDFTGGSLAEISYPDGRPEIVEINNALEEAGYDFVTVLPTEELGIFVKSRDLKEVERVGIFEALTLGGEYTTEEISFTSIGPSLGKELARKATWALIIVALAIILFVAYAFRHVSKPVSSWRYGFIAVVALVHDVVLTSGVFVLISQFTGATADSLFVVALLTVLGLSVNDTIVVFDRVRENLRGKKVGDFGVVVGNSLKQTITRSINTSISTIIVLLALFFFGPASIQTFALTLAFGMLFGTYSSIFLASPLLVMMQKKED
jgi:preprotein translocase subunit SecF